MEKYVAKTKILRSSKQASRVRIMVDNKKELEHMKYVNYLGSTITSDARCTREIEYRIVMAKAPFNK